MDGNINKVRERINIVEKFIDEARVTVTTIDKAIEARQSFHEIKASISTIDPEAIKRECLESIRSHFRSMTQADIVKWDGPGVLGGAMSKELFNKTLEYAILGAELAQDKPKLPPGFNPDDPCDSCAREVGDPACLNCENIAEEVDSEWMPKEAEPAQDDVKPTSMMTMIENSDMSISWECSICNKTIADRDDIESVKKCPHCGAIIREFLYIEEAKE